MSKKTIERLEPGEVQLRKVFEDTIRNNLNTVIDFSNDTRNQIKESRKEVKALSNMVITQSKTIEQLKKQLAVIQQKLYSGGS